VFEGNVALRGSGGAAASGGSLTLLSSLVRGNSAKSNAGGVAGFNGTISLVDVQLIDNTAGLDGTLSYITVLLQQFLVQYGDVFVPSCYR
jgi:hypothetical protein